MQNRVYLSQSKCACMSSGDVKMWDGKPGSVTDMLRVWLHTQPFTHLECVSRNVSVAGCGTGSALLMSEHIPPCVCEANAWEVSRSVRYTQLPSGYTHLPKIRLLSILLVNIVSTRSHTSPYENQTTQRNTRSNISSIYLLLSFLHSCPAPMDSDVPDESESQIKRPEDFQNDPDSIWSWVKCCMKLQLYCLMTNLIIIIFEWIITKPFCHVASSEISIIPGDDVILVCGFVVLWWCWSANVKILHSFTPFLNTFWHTGPLDEFLFIWRWITATRKPRLHFNGIRMNGEDRDRCYWVSDDGLEIMRAPGGWQCEITAERQHGENPSAVMWS